MSTGRYPRPLHILLALAAGSLAAGSLACGGPPEQRGDIAGRTLALALRQEPTDRHHEREMRVFVDSAVMDGVYKILAIDGRTHRILREYFCDDAGTLLSGSHLVQASHSDEWLRCHFVDGILAEEQRGRLPDGPPSWRTRRDSDGIETELTAWEKGKRIVTMIGPSGFPVRRQVLENGELVSDMALTPLEDDIQIARTPGGYRIKGSVRPNYKFWTAGTTHFEMTTDAKPAVLSASGCQFAARCRCMLPLDNAAEMEKLLKTSTGMSLDDVLELVAPRLTQSPAGATPPTPNVDGDSRPGAPVTDEADPPKSD